ncbi:hypothetical protein BCR32DRAFT_265762 [Anaeromyces robustus]|uniref:FAM192A/Fyv6 N-terminal domain-containing protein n=1 Tax=Anaeromyces robustus TaxID=1754192 RepID=A0A1Y1XHL1_9FUNG|nr:hypothetical protein BCR32DRAFT_265762 [Anaeromyces robustus]|eukprot:ORX85230.1 hypothetical protein BCR32DRAFT_265762 [Anaeromyces robustus]
MDRFVSREILDESKPNFGEVKKPESSVPYDPRPLYQRLAENKRKAEDELLEKNKLSNFIYQMNNDEYDFLNNVKEEENLKYKQLKEEEEKEVEKFRRDVESSILKTPYLDSLLKETSTKEIKEKEKEKKVTPKVQSFQKNLLQNIIVKKKRGRDSQEEKETIKEKTDIKKVKQSSLKPEKSKNNNNTQASALSLLANYSDTDSDSQSDANSD